MSVLRGRAVGGNSGVGAFVVIPGQTSCYRQPRRQESTFTCYPTKRPTAVEREGRQAGKPHETGVEAPPRDPGCAPRRRGRRRLLPAGEGLARPVPRLASADRTVA